MSYLFIISFLFKNVQAIPVIDQNSLMMLLLYFFVVVFLGPGGDEYFLVKTHAADLNSEGW